VADLIGRARAECDRPAQRSKQRSFTARILA
jgi:hypothetical protein